ncbi:MAG: signal recognition particle-docking protein FtsY [Vampirovibrionales bacterium]|nr:signal recognition particle-docking protein FtsY [Vampirovibrionales bacterium]
MTLLSNASQWLEQLKVALTGTRQKMANVSSCDDSQALCAFDFEEALESVESGLLKADVGLDTSDEILKHVRLRQKKIMSYSDLRHELSDVLGELLGESVALKQSEGGLSVILMVGVNGSGKTTTLGKLAHRFKQQGKSVILGAGDTFRAAAQEQLGVWADRVGCPIIQKKPGTDPAAVVFETIQTALKTQTQIALIDTAGRLQSKTNLMQELTKVRLAIDKALGEQKALATVDVLLVLDAVTGQNALQQAEGFLASTGLTGVVLTKLDGSAKGGVVFAIKHRYQLPVKLVGLGEGLGDLADFDSQLFIQALLPA